METLHSIPRAYDVAYAINGNVAPIFEVILPMCTSSQQIETVRSYYEQIIIGQKNTKLETGNGRHITVCDWVGDFKPESINVIPLFEDYDTFLSCNNIMEKYLKGKKLDYQRVFLARSDPALNYGSITAVLLAKLSLQRLFALEQKCSVEILPILGVGSAPFRGNFRPDNISNCGEEYPSVQTFTVQSSFKYDHQFRDVANAVDMINHWRRRPPRPVEESTALLLAEKIRQEYQRQIAALADMINSLSAFIPARRARKLHVGLFGYARSMKGIKLPRAIKFCAAFYSLGLPPELLGLNGLSEKEFDELHTMYIKLDEDLDSSVRWLNKSNLEYFPKPVTDGIKKILEWVDYEEEEEYSSVTSKLMMHFRKGDQNALKEEIKRAAWMRKFLG